MSTSVPSITPERFADLLRLGQTPMLLDVRTKAEYRAGHAEGARPLSLDEIDLRTLPALIGKVWAATRPFMSLATAAHGLAERPSGWLRRATTIMIFRQFFDHSSSTSSP